MKEKKIPLLISLGVFVFVSVTFFFSFFRGPEYFLRDTLVGTKLFDDRIVILSVDDASLKALGQWPWPRKTFGEIFSKLEEAKPLAVGFDVILAEASRLGRADDVFLAETLRKTSFPLVLPVEADRVEQGDTTLYEAEVFTETREEFFVRSGILKGHVNLILDRDGVVRRVPTSVVSGDKKIRSFSLALAGMITKVPVLNPMEEIVYAAYPDSIRRFSAERILKEDLSNLLRNKVVLIGATSPDLHDEKPTPLSRGRQMAGVEIQANILNQFLLGYSKKELGPTGSYLLLLALSLLPALTSFFLRSTYKMLAAGVGILALFIFASILAEDGGIHLPIVHGVISVFLSTLLLFTHRYFIGDKEKREIKKVFSKYVSPEVLKEILVNPEKIALGGEEKEITVLFSDIRGFTTLSEKCTPTELVEVLNRYFTRMTNQVLLHGGVLDKYIGDAVMAFWGAPLPDPDQVDNALKAAIGMIEELREFNKDLEKERGVTIDIGVGLYTGRAVVGNIGSDKRFDYTAMGDTVNVASRLEGLNKEYKTHIIIGEPTKEKVTLPVSLKPLGGTKVKGREKELQIFTVTKDGVVV